MDDFLENPQAIYEIANAQPEHLPVVIAPPMRLERGEVVNRYIGKIISCAAPYFDVIVVNTGAVWIDCHAQLLELSDKAMFVVDQRASSVRSTRHALDLCFRLGISNSDFVFLLNRCSRASTFTAVDISCALDGGLVYEVKDGGSVVEESLGSGHVEDLATSKNEMITSLSEALDKVFETSAKVSALKRRAAATPLADANLYASVSQETRGKRRGLLHKSKDRKHRDAVSDTVLKPSGNMAEAIQWA
jgi:pilus assembly protein CpaE